MLCREFGTWILRWRPREGAAAAPALETASRAWLVAHKRACALATCVQVSVEDYGAFVDFGCKQQGLIHVSKLAVSRPGGCEGQAGRSRNAQPPPCLDATTGSPVQARRCFAAIARAQPVPTPRYGPL